MWVAIPSPGDRPDPGTEPKSLALQAGSLPPEPPGKPLSKLEPSTQAQIEQARSQSRVVTRPHKSEPGCVLQQNHTSHWVFELWAQRQTGS